MHHAQTAAWLVGQHRSAHATGPFRQAQDAVHAHREATVQVHGLQKKREVSYIDSTFRMMNNVWISANNLLLCQF